MLDLPLTFLQRPATATTPHPWLLVLMHGVGSNEDDLFALAPHIPPAWHVLSLGAPHALRGMPPASWAWFEFAVRPDGSRDINAAQEAHSRALIQDSTTQAASALGIPASRVVLGGFSQGGIMAMSILRTQPALLRAAMACTASSDDATQRQSRHIRDALARQPG